MPTAAAVGDGTAAPPPDPVPESVMLQSLLASQTVGNAAN